MKRTKMKQKRRKDLEIKMLSGKKKGETDYAQSNSWMKHSKYWGMTPATSMNSKPLTGNKGEKSMLNLKEKSRKKKKVEGEHYKKRL